MKGKVFTLVALLALAVLIAGCGEKAGEATRSLSPQPDPPGVVVNAMKVEQDSLRADVEMLKTNVAQLNIKYDALKADNAALTKELVKFTQATNGKFELLKVKAGFTPSDVTKWETFPLLTGYYWSGASR